jgi:hypothetical protein
MNNNPKQTLKRYIKEGTSQRFSKNKRGATPPANQRTFAPNLLLPSQY